MRNVCVIPSTPNVDGPLGNTRIPTTFEDIALQMGVLVDDCADVGMCHLEADRLLMLALHMIATGPPPVLDEREELKKIINTFYTLRKWYE